MSIRVTLALVNWLRARWTTFFGSEGWEPRVFLAFALLVVIFGTFTLIDSEDRGFLTWAVPAIGLINVVIGVIWLRRGNSSTTPEE